jgi:hypothetical protein
MSSTESGTSTPFSHMGEPAYTVAVSWKASYSKLQVEQLELTNFVFSPSCCLC